MTVRLAVQLQTFDGKVCRFNRSESVELRLVCSTTNFVILKLVSKTQHKDGNHFFQNLTIDAPGEFEIQCRVSHQKQNRIALPVIHRVQVAHDENLALPVWFSICDPEKTRDCLFLLRLLTKLPTPQHQIGHSILERVIASATHELKDVSIIIPYLN